MTRLDDRGSTMVFRTHDGQVTSPKVLIATNAFVAGHRKIPNRVAAIRESNLMTANAVLEVASET